MRSRLKPSQGAPEGAHQGLSAHRQTAQAASQLTTKQSGDAGEDQALRYLTRAGLQLVVRHYRTPGRGGGEIDLIMREPDGTLSLSRYAVARWVDLVVRLSRWGRPSSGVFCWLRAIT